MQTHKIDLVTLKSQYQEAAWRLHGKAINRLNPYQLESVIADVLNMAVFDSAMKRSMNMDSEVRNVRYLCMEYLIGRVVHYNMYNMGILEKTKEIFDEEGIDINCLEDIEDAAEGNGGLGRLAVCLLDSAANGGFPVDGEGLFYKKGLFKQLINTQGRQVEVPDDWTKNGNPWFKEMHEEAELVKFRDTQVLAVPCVTPVVGYNLDRENYNANVSVLRLWKAVPMEGTNASAAKISEYLYPRDETDEGKILRIRQEYFFVSACMQRIFRIHKAKHGNFDNLEAYYEFQMNDTHPVMGCLEFIRLLKEEGYSFKEAFEKAKKCFNYTNHTIMSEALEKWPIHLFKDILPDIFKVVEELNWALIEELKADERFQKVENGRRVTDWEKIHPYELFRDGLIYMGRIACFVSKVINGVAEMHSQIIKEETLAVWHQIYPERFTNVTNGITQRRWIALSNPGLAKFLDKYVGKEWIVNLDLLKNLEQYADDNDVLAEYADIKYQAKAEFARYVKKRQGIDVDPSSIFDCQVKRIHTYKRQDMNAFRILMLYKLIKAGELKDFPKTTFIIGGKAASGFAIAKDIIALINDIQNLVNNDPDVKDKMQVVFLTNYNVSYGEKVYPAANFSEQISTVGTEASGTGNMKFSLNGAPTIGTLDGANREIVEVAGWINNYIFGKGRKEFEEEKKKHRQEEFLRDNPDLLYPIDMLKHKEPGLSEEYWSLSNMIEHNDVFYVMYDLRDYTETSIRAFYEYAEEQKTGNFAYHTRKAFLNIANCGKFSSDRSIREYAENIWHVEPVRKIK